MGGLCSCMFRLFCCDCSCCEPNDDWNIENEARDGEKGAGWIYKKAKGSDLVWSKRYFVLTSEKLFYFTDRDRLVKKGEIVLAGAIATESTTRADTKKIFYFTISHPQCGSRDFYAKTRNRRSQWMNKINEISNELSSRAIYGKLLKQGGMSKNVWQERWCISTGTTIDYFDGPTDNQSKGSLYIVGATIKPMNIKDKFCFEVATAQPGKKGNKKYVFGTDKEHERDLWVERLTKLSTGEFNAPQFSQAAPSLSTDGSIGSPLHAAVAAAAMNGEPTLSTDGGGGIMLQNLSMSSRASVIPQELSGYLQKKSPAMMKGWQKRYFKTLSDGDINYYKSAEDASNPNAELKGQIRLIDIMHPNGIELNESTFEFTIKTQTKKIQLKAKDLEEAMEWVKNIEAWITHKYMNASIE